MNEVKQSDSLTSSFCFFESIKSIHAEPYRPLATYTDEQRKFIEDPIIQNCKLISPPGSGKTTCILGRRHFLIHDRKLLPENILVVTFTRASAKDLQARMNDIGARTIDSLAHSCLRILRPEADLTKQIMSVYFKQYLTTTTTEELGRVPLLKALKVLMVDEAQDLNQDQYDIVMMLKDLLDLTVCLVGDPNQSIYGFRGSSSEYLLDFVGTTYILTINFRSTPEIVAFTEHLKPHREFACRSHQLQNKTTCVQKNVRPLLLHDSLSEFETRLSDILSRERHNLSEIAIMCPTKGNNNGNTSNTRGIIGLARMATLLDIMGIPFVQLYDEGGAEVDGEANINAQKRPGHVNLLTYHGSKGLEWDIVICADMWHDLMTRTPTKDEEKQNKYLLYVATTRARKELVIFIGNNENRKPTPLLSDVPMDTYDGFVYFERNCGYRDSSSTSSTSSTSSQTKKQKYSVTAMVRNISQTNLMRIMPLLTYRVQAKQLWPDMRIDALAVIGTDNIVLGCFLENLFSLQCSCYTGDAPRHLPLIESILHGRIIIVTNSKALTNLTTMQALYQTWDYYDAIQNTLPDDMKRLMDQYGMRDIPLERHFFTCNTYMNIISDNKAHIKHAYDRYSNCNSKWQDDGQCNNSSWQDVLEELFYLTVVIHAYKCNHLYHIKEYGARKRHIIDDRMAPLFRYMDIYAAEFVCQGMYHEQVQCALDYPAVCGVADCVFEDQTLVEFKASQDDVEPYRLLQMWCYQMALQLSSTKPVALINFLSGRRFEIQYTMTEEDIEAIVDILNETTCAVV